MAVPKKIINLLLLTVAFSLVALIVDLIVSKQPDTSLSGDETSINKISKPIDTLKKSGGKYQASEFGYALATHYSDQMTGAGSNIISLQCWARAISSHLKVVEPFIVGSTFGVNLNRTGEKEEMKLQDVYNMESWEEQLKGGDFSSIESWESFLKSAPRNLIIVGRICNIKEGESENCDDKFRSNASLFAKKHKFNISRYIHLKDEFHTFDEFRDQIYGDHKPEQSVVLFERWGGIAMHLSIYRVVLLDMNPKCAKIFGENILFKSSLKIIEDSNRYLDRYMPKVNGTGYISAMFRAEHFELKHNFKAIKSEEVKLSLFIKCAKAIVNQVHNFQKMHKTSGVFLTVDSQKYGSSGFASHAWLNKDLVNSMVEMLFHDLQSYGIGLSLEEWDASFDEISSHIPGYVALVQKNIAANGTCLITAGGGTFHSSAVTLFKYIHSNQKRISTSKCYLDIPEC